MFIVRYWLISLWRWILLSLLLLAWLFTLGRLLFTFVFFAHTLLIFFAIIVLLLAWSIRVTVFQLDGFDSLTFFSLSRFILSRWPTYLNHFLHNCFRFAFGSSISHHLVNSKVHYEVDFASIFNHSQAFRGFETPHSDSVVKWSRYDDLLLLNKDNLGHCSCMSFKPHFTLFIFNVPDPDVCVNTGTTNEFRPY